MAARVPGGNVSVTIMSDALSLLDEMGVRGQGTFGETPTLLGVLQPHLNVLVPLAP